jgi:lactoylglutathione lyase
MGVEAPVKTKKTQRLPTVDSFSTPYTGFHKSAAVSDAAHRSWDVALTLRKPRYCRSRTPTQPEMMPMKYLHTMVRITDIDQSLDFYCNKLGMTEVRRVTNEAGRYTLIFLAGPDDEARGKAEKSPLVELTYNWDPEVYGEGRNFGHLAYEVDDIYATCDKLMKAGVTINRPPRDGRMAFVRSPDNISFELLQKGESKPKQEPWASMPNTGKW